jgi:hypothetical protein
MSANAPAWSRSSSRWVGEARTLVFAAKSSNGMDTGRSEGYALLFTTKLEEQGLQKGCLADRSMIRTLGQI